MRERRYMGAHLYAFTFIYAFRCAGLIKIGCSSSPWKRIGSARWDGLLHRRIEGFAYSLRSPPPIELLAATIGDIDLEAAIHRIADPDAARCLDGLSPEVACEWFAETNGVRRIVAAIRDASAAGVPLTPAAVLTAYHGSYEPPVVEPMIRESQRVRGLPTKVRDEQQTDGWTQADRAAFRASIRAMVNRIHDRG